jgi:glycerol kinase
MPPQYVAAIDQGTTGTRFMIFDRQGQVVSSLYEEHQQIYPQPGWVEHDAGEIWAKTRRVTGGALAESGVSPAGIAGIGITNQRETTVVWDAKSGQPLYNAVVWQDTRTRDICQRLQADGLDKTRPKLRPSPHPWPTRAASTLCLPSPASSPPIGTWTRGA